MRRGPASSSMCSSSIAAAMVADVTSVVGGESKFDEETQTLRDAAFASKTRARLLLLVMVGDCRRRCVRRRRLSPAVAPCAVTRYFGWKTQNLARSAAEKRQKRGRTAAEFAPVARRKFKFWRQNSRDLTFTCTDQLFHTSRDGHGADCTKWEINANAKGFLRVPFSNWVRFGAK